MSISEYFLFPFSPGAEKEVSEFALFLLFEGQQMQVATWRKRQT